MDNGFYVKSTRCKELAFKMSAESSKMSAESSKMSAESSKVYGLFIASQSLGGFLFGKIPRVYIKKVFPIFVIWR